MYEKTGFELAIDYLCKNNIEFSTHVEDKVCLLLYPHDPISSRKFIVSRKNNMYFIAHDTYSTKAFDSKTSTGLFNVMNKLEVFNLKMYKKHWIDSIFRVNNAKTGNPHIDKYVTITSCLKSIPHDIFSKDAGELFLEISKRFSPVNLVIEKDHIPFVNDLKNKVVA